MSGHGRAAGLLAPASLLASLVASALALGAAAARAEEPLRAAAEEPLAAPSDEPLGLRAAQPPARAADEPPTLHFDPFDPAHTARPPSGDARAAARPPEFTPVLRSTVVAGERSLANLSGAVLALGEESHGYRLLEVGPWQAVFEVAGERVTLEVARGEDRP